MHGHDPEPENDAARLQQQRAATIGSNAKPGGDCGNGDTERQQGETRLIAGHSAARVTEHRQEVRAPGRRPADEPGHEEPQAFLQAMRSPDP